MTKAFRAFDDEQLALLKSLLSKDYLALDRRAKAQATCEREQKPRNKSAAPGRRAGSSLDPGDLNMTSDHALRVKGNDFSWIPSGYSSVIDRTLREAKVKIRPRRDQLIVIGHMYFKRAVDDLSIAGSINVEGSITQVSWARIDPALPHALSFKRLAWIALVHKGRAIEWEPANLKLIDCSELDGSRHLRIWVLQGRQKAISAALRSGRLCIALLAGNLRAPKSFASDQLKPFSNDQIKRHQSKRKPKKDYVRANLISGGTSTGFSDGGSALISGSGWASTSTGKQPKSRSKIAKSLPKPVLIGSPVITEKPRDWEKSGIDLCGRCNGGELPNCPVCDGSGFVRSSSKQQSIFELGRDTSMSGVMSVGPSIGSSARVADHEAVGRADPQDANRGASGVRDGSRFGSMPLYDNYDD